jgi:hypothetical protein
MKPLNTREIDGGWRTSKFSLTISDCGMAGDSGGQNIFDGPATAGNLSE